MQHVGQAVDDAALDIGLGGLRLHDDAAIDGEPVIVNPDLAAIPIERDFRDTGTKRSGTLGDRDPERAVVRSRRFPVRRLGHGFERRAGPRRGAHAIEPERDRIHALIRRHLVDEALDGEQIEVVGDAAPMLDANPVGDVAQLDALVRHAVVGNLHAAGQQHPAAVADDRVAPADHLAGAIERRLDALVVLRPEHAVAMSSSRVQTSSTGRRTARATCAASAV